MPGAAPAATPIARVRLRDDATVPALGFGTWHMGEDPARAAHEAAVVGAALDAGMTLIDTAEMYGDGGSEEVVGRALAGRPRDDVFVVSKVYPHNAGARSAAAACEASLRRLGLDHLDLYLLHWRGRIPIAETVRAFSGLVRDGLVRRWGVSNFDVGDMEDLFAVRGGDGRGQCVGAGDPGAGLAQVAHGGVPPVVARVARVIVGDVADHHDTRVHHVAECFRRTRR